MFVCPFFPIFLYGENPSIFFKPAKGFGDWSRVNVWKCIENGGWHFCWMWEKRDGRRLWADTHNQHDRHEEQQCLSLSLFSFPPALPCLQLRMLWYIWPFPSAGFLCSRDPPALSALLPNTRRSHFIDNVKKRNEEAKRIHEKKTCDHLLLYKRKPTVFSLFF